LVENLLNPANGSSFSVLNTNSLLLALEILSKGLGYWKVLIDFIFILIFLLPLIIVIKSKEIKQSEYVRELALSELSITFYHYLHTQKLCKKIERDIKSNEILFSKNSKSA
jgi:serine/threonine protein kinase